MSGFPAFQHTAARRRLVGGLLINPAAIVFQHTAARRRLEIAKGIKDKSLDVSTHSRPKAAGRVSATSLSKMRFQHTAARRRLVFTASIRLAFSWFQHTAARRRLAGWTITAAITAYVSTHSRPKAAGETEQAVGTSHAVSTHSRPKAAGTPIRSNLHTHHVSTHSRPKAAGSNK